MKKRTRPEPPPALPWAQARTMLTVVMMPFMKSALMTSALLTASLSASASSDIPSAGTSRNSTRSFLVAVALASRSSLRDARALRLASVAMRPDTAGPSSTRPRRPFSPLSESRPAPRPAFAPGPPRPGAGAPKRPPPDAGPR